MFKELDPVYASIFKQALNRYPQLQEDLKNGTELISYNFPQFAEFLFARLLSNELQLVDKSTLKPEEGWMHSYLSKLDRNLDFQLLAGQHTLDTTAIALHCLLALAIAETPHPDVPLTEDVGDLRAAVLELKRKCPGVDLTDMITDGKRAADAMRNYEMAIHSISNELISVICREAHQQFKHLIEPLTREEDLEGFLDSEVISLEEKGKIAKIIKNSRKLQKIVELAGKMVSRALQKQESKTEDGLHTIDGVETGSTLSRALPAELGLAKAHFLSFAKKFSERALSQFRMGKDKRKSGSIVVLLDDTGSMRGNRELWAKSVTWAVMAIAREQNRNLRLIHWGKGANRIADFAAGEYELGAWLEEMEYFGADKVNQEDKAFDVAMEAIASDSFLSGADIVFITDGGWMDGGRSLKGWETQLQQKLDESGTDVYTVTIQCGAGHIPAFLLKNHIHVGDIANEVEALDRLFESL